MFPLTANFRTPWRRHHSSSIPFQSQFLGLIDTQTLGSSETFLKPFWMLIRIKWLKSDAFLDFHIPFQSQFLGLPTAIDTTTLGSSESSIKTLKNEVWLIRIKWLQSKVFLIFQETWIVQTLHVIFLIFCKAGISLVRGTKENWNLKGIWRSFRTLQTWILWILHVIFWIFVTRK